MSTQDELFWQNMFKLATEQKISDARYTTLTEYHKTFQEHLSQLTNSSSDQDEEHARLRSYLLQAKKMAFAVLALLSECIITAPNDDLLSQIEDYEETFFDLLHKTSIESIDFQRLIDEAKIKIIEARYQPDLEILSDMIESINQPLVTLPTAKTPTEVWNNLKELLLENNIRISALEKRWEVDQKNFEQLPFDKPEQLKRLRGKKLETALWLIDRQLKSSMHSPEFEMNIHQKSIAELEKILSSEGIPKEDIHHYTKILLSSGSLSMTPQRFRIYISLLARHHKNAFSKLVWCDVNFWEFPVSILTNNTLTVLPCARSKNQTSLQSLNSKKYQQWHQYITIELIRLNHSIKAFKKTIAEHNLGPYNIQHELHDYLSALHNQYSAIEKIFENMSEACAHHKTLSKQKESLFVMGQALNIQTNVLQNHSKQLSDLLVCFKDWADASLNQAQGVTQRDRQTVQTCYAQHAIAFQNNIQTTLSYTKMLQKKLSITSDKDKKRFSLNHLFSFLTRPLIKQKKYRQELNDLKITLENNITQLSDMHTCIDKLNQSALDHISSVRFINKVVAPPLNTQELLLTYTEKQAKNFNDFLDGSEIKDCYFDTLCDEIQTLNNEQRIAFWVGNEQNHQRLLQQATKFINQSSYSTEERQHFETKYHYLEQVIRYFMAVKKESYLCALRIRVDSTLSQITRQDVKTRQLKLESLRDLLGPSKAELKQLLNSSYASTKNNYEQACQELASFKNNFSPITQDKINCLIQLMLRKKITKLDKACRLIPHWDSIVKRELDLTDQYKPAINMIEKLCAIYNSAKQLSDVLDNLEKDISTEIEQSFSPRKIDAYLKILSFQPKGMEHNPAFTYCHYST